ncbi:MAG: hypothetical protein Dbin4_01234 [Alphaproteobacteria bacterium]|nr:hypothetical protein [Alphaproteobacteria bacterium]
MGLLNIIRRMHLRQKLSIREIARLTGVSRNTVTKHLAANTIEPKFAAPERQSKIDPLADKLAGWLKTEAGKSRKERRTVKQLHAGLVALGFTGSYARVAAFARRWKADRQREQQTAGRGTFGRCILIPAKPSSSTGARILRFWAASAPSCRWRISSCRTAAPFCSAPIRCRPMRCYLMLIGTRSGSSAACRGVGFTTTCARRWIVPAADRRRLTHRANAVLAPGSILQKSSIIKRLSSIDQIPVEMKTTPN